MLKIIYTVLSERGDSNGQINSRGEVCLDLNAVKPIFYFLKEVSP